MNHRDKLHRKFPNSKSNTDWNMYKTAWNQAANIIWRTQKNALQVCRERFWKNPNKFWKRIKTIFPSKTREPPAKSFSIDAKCTTNKKSIASRFCSFFSKIAGALKEKSIKFKNFVWSTRYKAKTKTKLAFKLIPVTVSEVFVKLKKLKR